MVYPVGSMTVCIYISVDLVALVLIVSPHVVSSML